MSRQLSGFYEGLCVWRSVSKWYKSGGDQTAPVVRGKVMLSKRMPAVSKTVRTKHESEPSLAPQHPGLTCWTGARFALARGVVSLIRSNP